MEVADGKLTNLQLELLRIFSFQLPDEQLLQIRNLLANYFAERVDEEFEKAWKEKGYNMDTIKEWSKEHMRTPYK